MGAEQVDAIAEAVAAKLLEKQRGPTYTLGELAGMYLDRMMKRVENPDDIEVSWRTRLSIFKDETQDSLTVDKIETLLESTCRSGSRWNKTRSVGLRLVSQARRDGLWSKPNPFEQIDLKRQEERDVRVLTPSEIAAVMAVSSPRIGTLIATAYLTGRRKGDLQKLRRDDLDLERRVVTWRKTKNGKTYTSPLNDQLVPILRDHMAQQESDLVFPSPAGGKMRRDSKLADRLRRAIGRAGIVEKYALVCRRKGCGFRSESKTRETPPCDRCGFKLWATPVPPELTWHDLRHMTTTTLLELGVPKTLVKEFIGHTTGDITDHYTHFGTEFVREMINRLRIPEAHSRG